MTMNDGDHNHFLSKNQMRFWGMLSLLYLGMMAYGSYQKSGNIFEEMLTGYAPLDILTILTPIIVLVWLDKEATRK